MRRVLIIFVILLPLFYSCSKGKIISKSTMKEIIFDMYLADCYSSSSDKNLKNTDSLLIYETIFNKYGYTTEDYNRSVKKYLLKPAKFAKLFTAVQNSMTAKRDYLTRLIEIEEGRQRHWELLDSIELYASETIPGNGYYRAIRTIFFTPDSIPFSYLLYDSTAVIPPRDCFHLYDMVPDLQQGFQSVISRPGLPPSDSAALKKGDSTDDLEKKLKKAQKMMNSRVQNRDRRAIQFEKEAILPKENLKK